MRWDTDRTTIFRVEQWAHVTLPDDHPALPDTPQRFCAQIMSAEPRKRMVDVSRQVGERRRTERVEQISYDDMLGTSDYAVADLEGGRQKLVKIVRIRPDSVIVKLDGRERSLSPEKISAKAL